MTRMEPTEEMVNALYAWMGAHDVTLPDDALQSLLGILAASPGQGAVTSEQLEAAAEAVHRNSTSGRAWSRMGEDWKAVYRTHARAALEALGLTVQP